jgi:adenylosuccinate synthase
VRVNGLDELVNTTLDVLDDFDEIQVATGYDLDGRAVAGFPSRARLLERCVPRWRTFPGWRASTTAARSWEDLPLRAREYLEWIERECGVPISRVSVGAEREAEVVRS